MTPKEFLQQYRFLDTKINSKLEDVSRLRELAEQITSHQGDGASGQPTGDKIGGIVAKIVDLENEIDTDIEKLVDLRREIQTSISSVPDERLRLILDLRYIKFKRWEEIAVIMNIELRWIYRLHGRALQEIDH